MYCGPVDSRGKLGIGPGAQDNCAVILACPLERGLETLRHGQQGDQHADHPGNADDDRRRRRRCRCGSVESPTG